MAQPHDGYLPLGVSRETFERIGAFVDLLERWNGRINLISRGDATDIWKRHVTDSLQLAALVRPNDTIALDIGSGAGFPGLILAIATGTRFHLVESDSRKAAFLREASRVTDAPTTIHATRAEAIELDPVNLITARAVAPLSTLLGFAAKFLSPRGHCLFPKGKTADDELVAARKLWHMKCETIASQTDPGGTILDISEIARVQP
jgi:16S rRNA (guanine527-N7)-methyltransferase